MQAAGWLDSNQMLTIAVSVASSQLTPLLPAGHTGSSDRGNVVDELGATAADHPFSSDKVPRMLRFLSAHIPVTN